MQIDVETADHAMWSTNTETSNDQAVQQAQSRKESRSRLSFLDNLKVFLTALVLTHHVNCSFGGCGEDSWFLIVGLDGPPVFSGFVSTLSVLDQAFFMSLFFFVSAYFVPSSYKKKGLQKFVAGKRTRLLIPALFVFFVVSPASFFLAYSIVQMDTLRYLPSMGPGWFLFWLLLFNWVYASFTE